MSRPATRSRQIVQTQAAMRKTRSAKASINDNEHVDDPPPAKSSRRKPLPKPVEADESDKEATIAANKTAQKHPRCRRKLPDPPLAKKLKSFKMPLPMEMRPSRPPRRWGQNAPPPPPVQDPPRAETSPPPPAQAPSPHTNGHPKASLSPAETPPPPSTQSCRPRSKTPESEPEDPNDHLDKGYTPSDSDYGETEAARQLHRDCMWHRRHLPDMEAQDADDLEAFEDKVATNGGTKSKGKEKEGTKTPHKSGPIPNDAKEEAFALQATFRNGIKALAARIGKSPNTLYALIGKGAKISRCTVSLWGVFEAWYASEGSLKKPKTKSAQDWAIVVAGE
ncbi:hypothetical protein DXG01_001442 [Tephrocybe rancida]|nr:hypothetical protein DXG01_001442 [Tephrocybe rancida]